MPTPVLRKGTIVRLSGDSAQLWIQDYNCRVDSLAVVVQAPDKRARKVLVRIDEIDGDHDVTAYVRRSRLRVGLP